tara:strand:+ start:5808 stop:6101 length:294 start_codon:yes stop_codon:yes gene_type:complete
MEEIKSNITFKTWNEAQYCSRVLLNFNGRYSNKINKAIEDLGWRIYNKKANEDGTVTLRLSEDLRETVSYALTETSLSIVEMYKDKYSDSYFELFHD